MPTPNWGPQAGQPMNQVQFDDYVVKHPPGQASADAPNIYGTGSPWGPSADPYSSPAGNDPLHPSGIGANAAVADKGAQYWEDFYGKGPGYVAPVQFDATNADELRRQQGLVIQALQAQAAGDPNSQAQQQLMQGYGNAQAQQASLGSTMRGQSHGAALRGVQQGQQGIQRGLAGDQQMLMLQEQQAAQAQLAQQLAQQQALDASQAGATADGANKNTALSNDATSAYARGRLSAALGREGRARDSKLSSLGISTGFNNAYKDLVDQSISAATSAAATGLSTLGSFGSKPESSQSKIDKAFNGED